MSSQIKCPNCQHIFPMEEAVAEEYKRELKEKMLDYKRQKEEEIARKEEEWRNLLLRKDHEFSTQLLQEKEKWHTEAEKEMKQHLEIDYKQRLDLLSKQHIESQEKLKQATEKEADYLRRESEWKMKEAELDIRLQRQLQEERVRIAEELHKLEEEKFQLKEADLQMRIREKDKQLEQQKNMVEEMKRKAEQGSMQLQGEVQELALEDLLRATFPYDRIEEVGKGVRGADCIQVVMNGSGQVCGKIIFESKRTRNFEKEWINKLKADMTSQKADIAVLVTSTLPRDLDRFGEKEGIWVCSFPEVKAMVQILREGILRVAAVTRAQENKGDKMHLLYNYLTSNEFASQWRNIREVFLTLKSSIDKERDAMERIWKSREKQLERVIINASHIKASIEGIAGQDSIDFSLLDDVKTDTLPGG